jgi:hypothetical protein
MQQGVHCTPAPHPLCERRRASRPTVQGSNRTAMDNSLRRRRRARRTHASRNRAANASSEQAVQWAVRVPGNFCPIL